MTLYIDIENKKLVQSITSDRSVSTPVFMQGDNEPLEIFLLEKGEDTIFSPKALTVGNDFLRVAIARFKGYPKSLTYTSGYTLNPNGAAEVVLPLNTLAGPIRVVFKSPLRSSVFSFGMAARVLKSVVSRATPSAVVTVRPVIEACSVPSRSASVPLSVRFTVLVCAMRSIPVQHRPANKDWRLLVKVSCVMFINI